jgi:hypothetical protein
MKLRARRIKVVPNPKTKLMGVAFKLRIGVGFIVAEAGCTPRQPFGRRSQIVLKLVFVLTENHARV